MKIDPASYNAWYGSAFGSLCHRLEKDALFSLAKFRPGETVLDAGCGTGVYLEALLRLGLKVTGVDEDGEMLRCAAGSRGRGATLVKATLNDLPFATSSFDKVVSVCALEFTGDPPGVLAELTRVLKRDGALLLGFLNRNSAWGRLRMKKGNEPASLWRGARFFSLPEAACLGLNTGLQMTGVAGAVHFPPEDEGKEIFLLEAMESEGRRNSPSTAAFFGISFTKTAD